jgi:hypothetical protein
VGKGVLFLTCLYGLFFSGMYLGDWKNVYLPHATRRNVPGTVLSLASDLYTRLQYVGQFWIGLASWPALWQYYGLPVPSADASPFWHYFEHAPPEDRSEVGFPPFEHWQGKTLNELQTDGDKTWDLAWVYTVIAGALNVLVVYDAFAGPAFASPADSRPRRPEGAPA